MPAEKHLSLFETDGSQEGVAEARRWIRRFLFTNDEVRLVKKGDRVTVYGTEEAAQVVRDCEEERAAIQALE